MAIFSQKNVFVHALSIYVGFLFIRQDIHFDEPWEYAIKEAFHKDFVYSWE